jgi:peptidoglycan/LPS O-acetylase OafA/YrhL
MTPATVPERRLDALDGLRGLAALLVVTHNLLLVQTPTGPGSHLFVALLDRGWIGVQLFFALSGFLITGILLDARGEALGRFFARRVLRIFPLYYATLLGVLVLLPALGALPASVRLNPALEAWFWVYLSNWVGPYVQGAGPFPHFWSLAVEEQFYLLWPFVVGRRTPRQVFALSLAVAVLGPLSRALLLGLGQPQETAYQFTVCRIDGLALGAAAAAAWRVDAWSDVLARLAPRLTAAAAAVLLLGALPTHAYRIFGWWPQVLGYSALAAAFALWVLAIAAGGDGAATWSQRLLRHPGLRRVGLYSYGLYVLHVPLHLIVGVPLLARWGYGHPYPTGVAVAYVAAGTLVSYALAVASYHLFEIHFLRLKDRFPRAAPLSA